MFARTHAHTEFTRTARVSIEPSRIIARPFDELLLPLNKRSPRSGHCKNRTTAHAAQSRSTMWRRAGLCTLRAQALARLLLRMQAATLCSPGNAPKRQYSQRDRASSRARTHSLTLHACVCRCYAVRCASAPACRRAAPPLPALRSSPI